MKLAGGSMGAFAFCGFLLAFTLPAAPRGESPIFSLGADSKLQYSPDSQGNRVPDFSHCGYSGGARPIPAAPVRVVVAPVAGDSTARIQRAIDYVSSLPMDGDGLRGTVLLLKGRHEVLGRLRLAASGVVLRGQGMDEKGTVLVASGTDRRTLIQIAGQPDRTNRLGRTWTIADDYVPVGATSFRLADATGLEPGATISILRPCTQAWIERLGMTEFGGGQGDWRLTWKPGSRDLVWDRVVTAVEGDRVILDAPITTAIEAEFGGGKVEVYSWPGRLENVGVENLRCESTFDSANGKNEDHSWMAITLDNVQNAWVRQVCGTHFAGSLVAVYEGCKCVTVQDCLSLTPISEDGGYRRHTYFTAGQQTLFLRCHAEHGRHDFAVGHCAPGPNAFVQCDALAASSDSGPIESWASGVLYDNVIIDGAGLSLVNRGASPHGSGWAAANSMLWQCSAAFIRCENPPTARNWAFGCWGEFEGDGIWRHSNEFVKPQSLYAAQVADRLGPVVAARLNLMGRSTDDSTNPTTDQAAALIAASRKPAPQLLGYILESSRREPIPAEPNGAKTIEEIPAPAAPAQPISSQPGLRSTISISAGWLLRDGKLLVGRKAGVAWWRGNLRVAEAAATEPCLTRFVPGRDGPGFIDELDALAEGLVKRGAVGLEHHYGLWYDRRRDDHERVRRANGDVWPPFYEQPFARSGQGVAWDGLSRYDLTKYNPWYWGRLREFADACDRRGLVLFHQNYFQHNILEAGAHWADCPWRSANNLNQTDFPEPPPYAGDKRIFMAEQFYDVSHPLRRQLHRAYIRQCLDNFASNSNVIQLTSAEFTGPLAFVEFWLDTVAEWERETRRHPLVALSCTKDVQDAILADPRRSRVVDLIDFRYWWQTGKGLFAPSGGQNLAPRQFERQWRGGRPSDADLARMTAAYRGQFPAKSVICDFDSAGWAFLCAGGSLSRIPATTDARLLAAIPTMQPWPENTATNHWALRKPGSQVLAYFEADAAAELDLAGEPGPFLAHVIDLHTGSMATDAHQVTGGHKVPVPRQPGLPALVWLQAEQPKPAN